MLEPLGRRAAEGDLEQYVDACLPLLRGLDSKPCGKSEHLCSLR
jgi:hypothetical protein